MRISKKQAEVLSYMNAGMSFRKAYAKAGLSEYGVNDTIFLMRMMDGGLVAIVPTATETETEL